MMTSQSVLERLGGVGAIVTNGHFLYRSGLHGREYVNKDAVYPHTDLTSELCMQMAEHFKDDNVEVVVGPANGGIILSQWVAHHLSSLTGRKVLAVYAEKDKLDAFGIKRMYDKLIPDKRILIVEDILTTGGSAEKVVTCVRDLGGNVIGLCAICNRGEVTAEKVGNVPRFICLTNVSMDAFSINECPMCQAGIPINNDLGKGKEQKA